MNSNNTIPARTILKRLGLLMFLSFCFLGVGVTLSSCGSDDEPDGSGQTQYDPSLFGTWGMTKYLDNPASYSNLQAIEFNSDGTGKQGAYVLHQKKFSSPKEFNYSVSDNTVTLNYIDPETGDETGETATATYKFRGSRLDITMDGSTEEYMKL